MKEGKKMEREYSYQGLELDLFARAVKWNSYLASFTNAYVKGSVLEVGAGIGNKTPFFLTERVLDWLCLEPDGRQAGAMEKKFRGDAKVKVLQGTTGSLGERSFDTILYLDVLEHIEDDEEEVERILNRLRHKGHLVVIVPAHQFLYGPFDKEIGHFRRYQKRGLRKVMDSPLLIEKELFYVDSWGLLLSLANRIFFRKSMPSPRDVLFWDRCLVPLSRWSDPFLLHSLGKSLIGIWQKE